MNPYFYSFSFVVAGAAYEMPYGWGAVLDTLDALADEENQ